MSGAVRKKLVKLVVVIGGKGLRAAVFNILPEILSSQLAEHLLIGFQDILHEMGCSEELRLRYSDSEIQAVVGGCLKYSKGCKDKSRTTVLEHDSANEEEAS